MDKNKTLLQEIADWFSIFSFKKNYNQLSTLEDKAMEIIREQDRRIELLRDAMNYIDYGFGKTIATHEQTYVMMQEALAATSPDKVMEEM
jgi:hypothetical protein